MRLLCPVPCQHDDLERARAHSCGPASSQRQVQGLRQLSHTPSGSAEPRKPLRSTRAEAERYLQIGRFLALLTARYVRAVPKLGVIKMPNDERTRLKGVHDTRAACSIHL